jgi:hypothetical protein
MPIERRRLLALVAIVVVAFVSTGCGRGGSDDSPDVAITTQQAEKAVPTTPAPAAASGTTSAPISPSPMPLPTAERARIATRAADTQAAIRRWDDELAVCIGPTGEGDDSDATCTHEAWNELVLQIDVAMYYLLNDLRAMPRGACHDALAAENDLLRAFWHGAAPLNQAWLDEQQRPPSLFDLRAAVDLVRPVPERIRDAATTVCAA